MSTNIREEGEVLKSLLGTNQPFVTVKKLEAIAKECKVPYSEVITFIQGCRTNHDEIKKCLLAIARKYRPDLVEKHEDI